MPLLKNGRSGSYQSSLGFRGENGLIGWACELKYVSYVCWRKRVRVNERMKWSSGCKSRVAGADPFSTEFSVYRFNQSRIKYCCRQCIFEHDFHLVWAPGPNQASTENEIRKDSDGFEQKWVYDNNGLLLCAPPRRSQERRQPLRHPIAKTIFYYRFHRNPNRFMIRVIN